MTVLACFALCAMGLIAGTAWAGPEDGNPNTPYGQSEGGGYGSGAYGYGGGYGEGDDGYGHGYGGYRDDGYRDDGYGNGYGNGYGDGYGGCNPHPDGVAGNDCGYASGYGGDDYETPRGGVRTGGGGTPASGPDGTLIALGGMSLLAAAGIAGLMLRRRRDDRA